MLATLDREGIVERRASEVDRRSVTVRLTPSGRRAVGRKRAAVAEKRRQIFASLTPAERRQAEAILLRLAIAIEDL
jgi:DNA-binding MarR family transcriptional regulator